MHQSMLSLNSTLQITRAWGGGGGGSRITLYILIKVLMNKVFILYKIINWALEHWVGYWTYPSLLNLVDTLALWRLMALLKSECWGGLWLSTTLNLSNYHVPCYNESDMRGNGSGYCFLTLSIVGHVYTKAIRPWLLRIPEFSLVESVGPPLLQVQTNGSLGSGPTTSSMDEKSRWNPTLQFYGWHWLKL